MISSSNRHRIDDVQHDDDSGQAEDDHHADGMHPLLALRIDALAAQNLNQDEQHATAIQRRNRQQVGDAENDAEEAGEADEWE